MAKPWAFWRRSPSRLSFLITALLVCLFGIVISCRNTVLSGFQQIQTDPGDTRFNNYILEHGYQWLVRSPLHLNFWDLPDFYPIKNTLAYSDHLASVGPFYWVFRFLGFPVDTSYQLWTLFILGANFFFALIVFRRIGFSRFPSLAASYLFAFANMRIGQIGHVQLLPQFFMMGCLLSLYEIFRKSDSYLQKSQTQRWIIFFAVSALGQLYAAFYLGWFVIFGSFLLAVLALLKRNTRIVFLSFIQKNWATLTMTGVTSGLLLLPMITHYWQASQDVEVRTLSEIGPRLLRICSWLNMGESSFLYSFLHHFSAFQRIPWPDEQRAGIGLITLVLVIIGYRKTKDKTAMRLAAGLWFLVALSALYTGRRFFGVEPWDFVFRYFPGGQAVRAVSRLSFLALIPACLGLAAFFERIKNKRTLSWAILAIVALEQVNTTPSYDKFEIRQDVQALVKKVPSHCPYFFYSATSGNIPSYKLQIDAMFAGLELNIPTLNGFSGNTPLNWPLDRINDENKNDALSQDLVAWSSRHHFPFEYPCWIKD